MSNENINQAWLHAFELVENLQTFDDHELSEHRDILLARAEEIMKRLHDLVPEDMSDEEVSF